MLTQLGIMFNDNTNQAVPPSPRGPELQMIKIMRKFMLTKQRLPKQNCLVFMCFPSGVRRTYHNEAFYQQSEAVRASAALALSAG